MIHWQWLSAFLAAKCSAGLYGLRLRRRDCYGLWVHPYELGARETQDLMEYRFLAITVTHVCYFSDYALHYLYPQ